MRSISLPNVDKLRDYSNRHEDLSIVIGWIVHLLKIFAFILDTPLRYPVKLLGSQSTIFDHVKVLEENKQISREFPLYLKSTKPSNTEWERFNYGLYLLNKNLSQLRWQCGIPTTDMRPLLQNVAGLMALGKDALTTEDIVNALPRIRALTLPPTSTSAHPVLIKSPNSREADRTFKSNPVATRGMDSRDCVPELNSQTPISDIKNAKKTMQFQLSVGEPQNFAMKNEKIEPFGGEKNSDNITERNDNYGKNTHPTTSPEASSNSSSYDDEDTVESVDEQLSGKEITIQNQILKTDKNIFMLDKNVKIVDHETLENGHDNSDILATSKDNGGHNNVFDSSSNGKSAAAKHRNMGAGCGDNEIGRSEATTETESGCEQPAKEEKITSFWGDVTSRTNALSSKPSSFQRKRVNH